MRFSQKTGSITGGKATVANVLFLAAYVTYARSLTGHQGLRFARIASILALLLSSLVIVPLAFCSVVRSLQVGHGVWIAAQLALANDVRLRSRFDAAV